MLTQFFGLSALEIVNYVPLNLFKEILQLLRTEYDEDKIKNIYTEFSYYESLMRNNWYRTDVYNKKDAEEKLDTNRTKDFQKILRNGIKTEEDREFLEEVLYTDHYSFLFTSKLKPNGSQYPVASEEAAEFLNLMAPKLYQIKSFKQAIVEVLNLPSQRNTFLGLPVYNLSATNNYWFYKAIDELVVNTDTDKKAIMHMMRDNPLDSIHVGQQSEGSLESLKDELSALGVDVELHLDAIRDLYVNLENTHKSTLNLKEKNKIKLLFSIVVKVMSMYETYTEDKIKSIENIGIYSVNHIKTYLFNEVLGSCAFIKSNNMLIGFDEVYQSIESDIQIVERYLYNRDVSVGEKIG